MGLLSVFQSALRARYALAFVALAFGVPAPALAHFFVQSYSLPIPFWMYASGAAGALLLSFIAVGVFPFLSRMHGPTVDALRTEEPLWESSAVSMGGLIALGLLVLCILSGLLGPANSYDSFSMTFFWIVFVLGVPYLVALIGDFYAQLNPWRCLVACMERMSGSPFRGYLRDTDRWGHWPAAILYLGFINLELFGHLFPRTLSLWLLAYTALNLLGVWLLGAQAWFRQGEFFGVLLRLLGSLAPVEWNSSGFRFRRPFLGLLESQPRDMGLVIFVLFMLSSTAFDGLHATQPFVNFFWFHVNPVLMGCFELTPREQNTLSSEIYLIWQRLTLAGSPFIYLGFFVAILAATRLALRSKLSLRSLTFSFVISLVPIAFAYHATHYFILLLAQGGQIIRLAADPFTLGWNLLGTAKWTIRPIMLDMSVVWHCQVALILLGHVIGVWAAHTQALSLFGSPRRAALSQLPMLALMMLFTSFRLWILSLPLV